MSSVVTRQTVSKWELGVTTPEMDKLIQLSDFFHISIDELVGREELRNRLPKKQKQSRRRRPARFRYVPYHWHYEYKSRRTLFGLPLVHINIGRWIPGSEAPPSQRSACHRDCGVGNIRSRRSVLRNFLHRSALSRHPVSRCVLAAGLLLACGGLLRRSRRHRRVRTGSRRGRGMRHRRSTRSEVWPSPRKSRQAERPTPRSPSATPQAERSSFDIHSDVITRSGTSATILAALSGDLRYYCKTFFHSCILIVLH